MNALALPDLAPDVGALILYEAACRALAAAKTTDEVKTIRDKAAAMRAYAQQAKNRQLEVDAAEIRIRAERRLGELIQAQKGTEGLNAGGRPITGTDGEPVSSDARPTLAEAGIDKKLSSRAQKLAAVPEAKFEGLVAGWRERAETEGITLDLLGDKHPLRVALTGAVEWYTPKPYLDSARQVLGDFDLDPASSAIAQQQVRAKTYFNKEDDGLTKEWHGRIWLNPPYCDADKFVDKLLSERGAGRIHAAVLLVNAYCDTRWFHRAAAACSAICFTLGRIRFEKPDGQPGAPPHGSALIYFGDQVDRFHAAFAEHGIIMLPARSAP